MTHNPTIAIVNSSAHSASFVSILKELASKFFVFVTLRIRNWKQTRVLADLSERNLQDIGMTIHDVSLIRHERMPSSESLKLAELRKERSVNW